MAWIKRNVPTIAPEVPPSEGAPTVVETVSHKLFVDTPEVVTPTVTEAISDGIVTHVLDIPETKYQAIQVNLTDVWVEAGNAAASINTVKTVKLDVQVKDVAGNLYYMNATRLGVYQNGKRLRLSNTDDRYLNIDVALAKLNPAVPIYLVVQDLGKYIPYDAYVRLYTSEYGSSTPSDSSTVLQKYFVAESFKEVATV